MTSFKHRLRRKNARRAWRKKKDKASATKPKRRR